MEPPGTAPGSDPLMTSAFMSIVPKDRTDVAGEGACFKWGCMRRQQSGGMPAVREEVAIRRQYGSGGFFRVPFV